MEIKSVPGYWKAVSENGTWKIIDNGGKRIASIEPGDKAAETAFLVVNAPYMLEALQSLIGLIDDNDELSGAEVCDMARKAIALGLGTNILN